MTNDKVMELIISKIVKLCRGDVYFLVYDYATDGLTATITTDINPIFGVLWIDSATIIVVGNTGQLCHSMYHPPYQQKTTRTARKNRFSLTVAKDAQILGNKKHKDFSGMVEIVFNSKMKDNNSRTSHYLSI